MLFVELDLHSVVEFYLGAACISFDLYDLVVGIVVGDVLGDRCRDCLLYTSDAADDQ